MNDGLPVESNSLALSNRRPSQHGPQGCEGDMLIVGWRSSLPSKWTCEGAIDGTGDFSDLAYGYMWNKQRASIQVCRSAGTMSAFSSNVICDGLSAIFFMDRPEMENPKDFYLAYLSVRGLRRGVNAQMRGLNHKVVRGAATWDLG